MSVSRVCIIGAGPVGVAFAKYLVAEKAFSRIDVFEQRDNVGGIWNLSKPVRSKRIPIPQDDPCYGQSQKRRLTNGNGSRHTNGHDPGSEASLEFESPLYDYLETNIPKDIMAHSKKSFSEDLPLYPTHQDVLQYLEEYAEDVRHLIALQHQVTDVTCERLENEQDLWTVKTENLVTGEMREAEYDAVVVSNGHYTVPSVPNIVGVRQWNKAYPGVIIHSKAYRRPEDYTYKKVLVIGNSASGVDIAYQVSHSCKQPVLLSSRSVPKFGIIPPAGWKQDVDEVVEFLPSNDFDRSVRFRSGRIEKQIDAVIFCTGYFYAYPFLSDIRSPVVTDGLRTRDTFQHIFNIDHPTLVFPVINLKVVPFPLAENEAAVVARVWSGRLALPSKEEMRHWEVDVVKQRGDGKYFHLKKFPEDAAQINELYQWASTASRRQGLANDGQGVLGTQWNQKQVWLRSKFLAIKAEYNAKGKNRSRIKTVEELGFDFNKWRASASESDLDMFRQAKCA